LTLSDNVLLVVKSLFSVDTGHSNADRLREFAVKGWQNNVWNATSNDVSNGNEKAL
jgi:hypothetical protein